MSLFRTRVSSSNTELPLSRVFVPIGIGQLISALESLTQKSLYERSGYLKGVSAHNTQPGTFRHRIYSILDRPSTARTLSLIDAGASIALLARSGRRRVQIAACSALALSNRLNEVRTPYGRDGSDQMAAVIAQSSGQLSSCT